MKNRFFIVLAGLLCSATVHSAETKYGTSRAYGALLNGIPDACTYVRISTRGDKSIESVKSLIKLEATLKEEANAIIGPLLANMDIPISKCASPKFVEGAVVLITVDVAEIKNNRERAKISTVVEITDEVASLRNVKEARVALSSATSRLHSVSMAMVVEKTNEELESLLTWTIGQFLKANP